MEKDPRRGGSMCKGPMVKGMMRSQGTEREAVCWQRVRGELRGEAGEMGMGSDHVRT